MLVGIPRWWQRFRDTWVTRFELFDSRSLSLFDDSCELPHNYVPSFFLVFFFFLALQLRLFRSTEPRILTTIEASKPKRRRKRWRHFVTSVRFYTWLTADTFSFGFCFVFRLRRKMRPAIRSRSRRSVSGGGNARARSVALVVLSAHQDLVQDAGHRVKAKMKQKLRTVFTRKAEAVLL